MAAREGDGLPGALPPGRVGVLGPAAVARAAALAARGVTAEALPGDAAERVAAPSPDELFAAVLWPADFDGGSPSLRWRLLEAVRRWLSPGGLLLWEGAPPAPVEAAGFHLESAASPAGRSGGWTAARAGLTPPQGLAVATHRRAGAPPLLDLRWCADECEWLDPTPAALWAPLWQREPAAIAAAAQHYGLDDPYAGGRSAAVVSVHFGCEIAPEQLTWSAGTTALLQDLASLARGGPVLAPALAHPDLSAWATAAGVPVHFLAEGTDAAGWADAIRRLAPGLVHLDRPSLAGRRLPLAELAVLAQAAASVGAVVLVDEAYGAYFAGEGSAVSLVGELANLVVLRSLSKGYLAGGLRAGFAVASPGMAEEVRERVAPLGVAALSLEMALALLAGGDLFARLRARVREVKRRMIETLSQHGVTFWPGEDELPWLLIDDLGGRAWEALAARGIAGKRLGLSPLLAAQAPPVFRLSVPLSAERLAAWEALWSAPEAGGAA